MFVISRAFQKIYLHMTATKQASASNSNYRLFPDLIPEAFCSFGMCISAAQSLNQALCIPSSSYNHSLTSTFTKHHLLLPILRVLTHAQFINRPNSSLLDKNFFKMVYISSETVCWI